MSQRLDAVLHHLGAGITSARVPCDLQPDTAALAAATTGGPPSSSQPIETVRAGYRTALTSLGYVPAEHPVSSAEDIKSGPGVPVRVYRPAGSSAGTPLPCVQYMHGGGWSQGDVETYDGFCRYVLSRPASFALSVCPQLTPLSPSLSPSLFHLPSTFDQHYYCTQGSLQRLRGLRGVRGVPPGPRGSFPCRTGRLLCCPALDRWWRARSWRGRFKSRSSR